MLFDPGATDAEILKTIGRYIRTIRALAGELDIPASAVDGLIDEMLTAALMVRSNLDPERWIAGTVHAAAKRYAEQRQ